MAASLSVALPSGGPTAVIASFLRLFWISCQALTFLAVGHASSFSLNYNSSHSLPLQCPEYDWKPSNGAINGRDLCVLGSGGRMRF